MKGGLFVKINTVLNNRYMLVAEIGKGGMSTVFLAKDLHLDTYWAVKLINTQAKLDIEVYKKEVELLSTLNHSNIPRIVDRIEIENDYYVVMDFIDGVSLTNHVKANGPLTEEVAIYYTIMICEVVDYLHHAKLNPIIYSDMKPDNIMLNKMGGISLVDFGIAKECIRGTKLKGVSLGTRGYAAPEQYNKSSLMLDERTDIYGIGATLYFMITGITPGNPNDAINSITEGLEYIICKCCQNEPSKRYNNCNELKEDLKNIKQFTSSYRKLQKKKLTLFIISLTAFIVSIFSMTLSYYILQKELTDNYEFNLLKAKSYDREQDFKNAAIYYEKAISYKGDDYQIYLLLFNSLLPINSKSAIDEMRLNYLDNKDSKMYNNSMLMYSIVPKCIEENDAIYSSIAIEYIDKIKGSKEYKEKKIPTNELNSYEIIALYNKNTNLNQNFKEFNKGLLMLEAETDKLIGQVGKQMNNYYIIIIMYSCYFEYFDDSIVKITSIGEKSKVLLDSPFNLESIEFRNILPMYELVASSLYNYAISTEDLSEKKKYLLLSYEWFQLLVDMNDELLEPINLKRAKLYREISRLNMEYFQVDYLLDEAIAIYQFIITKNGNSFIAYINLTQTYLEKELLKLTEERNYINVNFYYSKVISMKNSIENLSVFELSQFISLKKQLQNIGLEN